VIDIPNRTARAVAVALVLATLAMSSCARLSAKKIGTILAQLDAYDGKTVTVIGTVQERIDVPAVKCYVLNDGTGSIGVVTKGRLPLIGKKVLAEGRVQRSFTIGARKLTVVIENPKPTPTTPAGRTDGRRGPG
jgi:hypothetical protein